MLQGLKVIIGLATFVYSAWRGFVLVDSIQDRTPVLEAILIFVVTLAPVAVLAWLLYASVERRDVERRV